MIAELGSWWLTGWLVALAVPPLVYLGVIWSMARGRTTLPPPGPATAELGPEPPALVALLLNAWRVDATVVAATLLDLAARRYVDIEPSGLIRLRRVDPAGLNSHEAQVLAHLALHVVQGGTVPVEALATGAHHERFRSQFRKAVLTDATRRSFSAHPDDENAEPYFTWTTFGTAVNAALLALVLMPDLRGLIAAPVLSITLAAAMIASISRPFVTGLRRTAAGRRTASAWLGVKSFLDAQDVFARLPPDAVTVWDRYLAYAAALGSAPAAVAALSPLWTGRTGDDAPVTADADAQVRSRRVVEAASARPAAKRRPPGEELGEVFVDRHRVTTPAGAFAPDEVRWDVTEDVREKRRIVHDTLARVAGLTFLFPLNLLLLAFLFDTELVGEVTVVCHTPGGGRFVTVLPAGSSADLYQTRQRLLWLGISVATPYRRSIPRA